MSRPTAKPAISKAPKREHPIAPESAASPTTAAPLVPARVVHSARIGADLRRALKRHAVDTDRTVEEVTEAAIREYLERNDVVL